MGLESFTNSSSSNDEVIKANTSSASSNNIGGNSSEYKSAVDKDISKYIDAASSMKEQSGEWPSKSYWNNHKDEYGISTWGGDLEEQIGVSFNNLLLLSGATPLDIHWQDLDEHYIDASLYLAASVYGNDFTAKDLQNTPGLVHTDLVKRVTGDTFSQRKDKLQLPSQKKKWEREKVIDVLNDKFNSNEEISRTKVNARCPFSEAVIKRFGDGKFSRGIEELGFNLTTEQETFAESHKKKNGVPTKVFKLIKSEQGYIQEADGYIYMLQLEYNDSDYYYIGKTVDIVHRMTRHKRNGGNVRSYVNINGKTKSTQNIDFDIDILAIKSLDKEESETEEEFDARLSRLERLKYNQACKKEKIEVNDDVIEMSYDKLLGGK